MRDFDLTFGLAFLAGLASFFSPCVLSIVPAYIGYLSGCVAGSKMTGAERRVTFFHGVAFALGFSLVFVLFNVIASLLGLWLRDLQTWIAKIGGVIVVILGLHMIGVFRIPFLEYDVRVHAQTDPRWGYVSSFLMGIFFSAGWSPCIGPILGMIATFAANGGSPVQGALLGVCYSTGLAIPFLLAALGIGWVTVLLRRHNKVMRVVEIVMGVLMVVIGILLILGAFNILAGYLPGIDFGL